MNVTQSKSKSASLAFADSSIDGEAKRVLRRLSESDAILVIALDMEKAVVVRGRADGSSVRTTVLDRDVGQAFLSKGWLDQVGKGRISRYKINAVGRAALERLTAEKSSSGLGLAEAASTFHSPTSTLTPAQTELRALASLPSEKIVEKLTDEVDRDDVLRALTLFVDEFSNFDDVSKETLSSEEYHRSVEEANCSLRHDREPHVSNVPHTRTKLSESPLLSIAQRRDERGIPFLRPELVAAGERLRKDYELAQMSPGIELNWDHFLAGGIIVEGSITNGPEAARNRVAAALQSLGPGLADVALRVCCCFDGLESTEKRMGWSARSGKIILRIALQRLEYHYAELERKEMGKRTPESQNAPEASKTGGVQKS